MTLRCRVMHHDTLLFRLGLAVAHLMSREEVRRGLLEAHRAEGVLGLLEEAGRTPLPGMGTRGVVKPIFARGPTV